MRSSKLNCCVVKMRVCITFCYNQNFESNEDDEKDEELKNVSNKII